MKEARLSMCTVEDNRVRRTSIHSKFEMYSDCPTWK